MPTSPPQDHAPDRKLARSLDGLSAPAAAHPDPWEPALRAWAVDAYFRHSLAASPDHITTGCCVIAVGGYGRSELCPRSDIDVLLLYPDHIPDTAQDLAEALFHPLWDLRLDVGHGVRTPSQCLDLAARDPKVLASLLDARPVAGTLRPFRTLRRTLHRDVLPHHAQDFLQWLDQHNTSRTKRFEDAAGLLEPDLKNGLGGLRDYHQLLWIARVLFGRSLFNGTPPLDAAEAGRTAREARVLLAARCALHKVAARKQDRLVLDLMPDTARQAGFQGRSPALAAEAFLSRLHRAMTWLRTAREAVFRESGGRSAAPGSAAHQPAARMVVSAAGVDYLRSRDARTPDATLALFRTASRLGVPLSWRARRTVRGSLCALDPLCGSRTALLALVGMARQPHGLAALQAMLETGALAALVPGFGPVQDMLQFDAFHLHPVGLHTLHVLDETRRILGQPHRAPLPPVLLDRTGDPLPLYLAALFHDLGKPDADHERTGAELTRRVLGRAGIDPDTVETAAFLVRHHLLLHQSLARTDTGDETALTRLAERIGSVRRLAQLAVLAVADARATGPKASSPWTESLLRDLCARLERLLASGPLARPHAVQTILRTRDRVRELARDRLDPGFVETRLDAMGPRYLATRDPGEILAHLELIRELDAALAAEHTRRPGGRAGLGLTLLARRELEHGLLELTVTGRDQEGLFATICGALALHGLNILDARIFTFADRTALDVFTIARPRESGLDELLERVRRSVHNALSGRLALEYRLNEKRLSPLAPRNRPSGLPPRVVLDTERSDFHTILDVEADDRLGLLFDLAETLRTLGADVAQARAHTRGDRVRDIFLLRTPDKDKLTDPRQLSDIRRAVTYVLGG